MQKLEVMVSLFMCIQNFSEKNKKKNENILKKDHLKNNLKLQATLKYQIEMNKC